MEFVGTIKTDITWLTIRGTDEELDKVLPWADKHSTMYVIAGKRKVYLEPLDYTTVTSGIITRLRAMHPNGPREQRFGFKSASDALRFRMSH